MDGFITVSNTYNNSVIITCQLVTELSSVDFDENRQPRLHKVISDHIIFEPIPDVSWITLESESARVNPCSVYNFRYTIDIPQDSGYSFDKDTGYLLYINVKKTLENATGANIGIDYNYKLFLIFTGSEDKQEQTSFFNQWMIFLAIPFIIMIPVIVIYKNKSHKKKENTHKIKFPSSIDVTPEKRLKSRPAKDITADIGQTIDDLLEREKTNGFRGGER